MARSTQISAEVSPSTKKLLEQYARATGMKKGYLIEQALLRHIHALQELPFDVIIPRKVVVSGASARKVVKEITGSAKPTRDLRKLMSRDAD